MKSNKRYAPWERERKKAWKLFLFGAFFLIIGAVLAKINVYSAGSFFAFFGVFLLMKGVRHKEQADVRQFGKKFEAYHLSKVEEVLKDFDIDYVFNVMRRGVGDIDIVVNTKKGVIPIEIKSFRYWNQYALLFFGKREKRTIMQAKKQMESLSAKHAIVWLPQGKPTLSQRIFGFSSVRRVHVFAGDEKKLAQFIAKKFG